VAIWFKVAIALNVIYWLVFFCLVSRRRWTIGGLLVGIFHMLFAGVVSVAPIRSTLDPNYTTFGVGFIQFNGQAAAFPAALLLGWALATAYIAVSKGKRSWMVAIGAGDIFLALNMGGSLALDNANDWTFQLGEYLTISGVPGLAILLFFFTGPFVASAIWALSEGGKGGMMPREQRTAGNTRVTNEDQKKLDGSRCIQSPA
jgi:hypothetical protein